MIRTITAASLLALAIPALAAPSQAGAQPIRDARVTFHSGAELTLHDVTVRTDSVIGFVGDARERRAYATPDVVSIARRELSVGRSSIVVVGAVAVAFLVVLGAAIGQLGNNIGATPAPSVP